jgi:hypothetical protein
LDCLYCCIHTMMSVSCSSNTWKETNYVSKFNRTAHLITVLTGYMSEPIQDKYFPLMLFSTQRVVPPNLLNIHLSSGFVSSRCSRIFHCHMRRSTLEITPNVKTIKAINNSIVSRSQSMKSLTNLRQTPQSGTFLLSSICAMH